MKQPPSTIDEYIKMFSPEIQVILEEIRATIRKATPEAEEKISYQMPAFFLKGALVYFGVFKKHIGFYPPVREETLKIKTSIYAGEKGNLKFPLDEPIPYNLISEIVKVRIKENLAREVEKKNKKPKMAKS